MFLFGFLCIQHARRISQLIPSVSNYSAKVSCRNLGITRRKQQVLGRTNRLLSLIRHGPHWERRVQQFFYCCVCIRHLGKISTEPLPSNDTEIFTEPFPSLPPACSLVCWTYFFDPEDGGDMFLRNVGWNSTDYTASYSRRWYSSAIRGLPRQQRNHISLLYFYF
jgi:hypothetical protein